jgi:tetratricopeptide (TPR) repeat protein
VIRDTPTGQPSPARRRGGRPLALAVGGALLILFGWTSVARVPEGSHAVTAARLLGPGFHLKTPFAALTLVPDRGRLDGVAVRFTTAEGADVPARLDLAYDLAPEALGRSATTLGQGGVAALVVREARAVATRDALVARLLEAGVRVSTLEVTTPAAEPAPKARASGLRLLVIGLDGADWDIVDPLLRAGRLPTFARLLRDGVRAPLRSYDPMISPLLWTTMATGVGPDVHGVADFQAVEKASGRRVPISSRFRRVKALWNIASDAGLTSAFVGWWASYPAEPVRGFQVSNLLAFETVRPRAPERPWPRGLVWPADYLDTAKVALRSVADLRYDDVRPILHLSEAEFEAARREILDARAEPPAEGAGKKAVQNPAALGLSILTGTRNYAAVAGDLAARHPDLTAVYFEGIDMMGHRFQHCMPPRMAICPDAEFARYRDAVTGFYEFQDGAMKQVLDAAGPGTTVLVVSDHGFRSGADRPADALPYTTEQPVEWHDRYGLFLLSGPGARKGARLSAAPTLFDIAPTLLHLMGLPAAADMPGRIVEEALDPAFAASHPPLPRPASYGAAGAPPSPGGENDPEARRAEADLLASLRSLGYIGGDEPAAGSPAGDAARPGGTADGATDTQVFYHRNLATYFFKQRDYAHAVEELKRANERQRLPKTDEMLAEAYLGLGRRDEAMAAIRDGLEAHPTEDPEPVLWLARLQMSDPSGAAAVEETRRGFALRTASKPGLDLALDGLLQEALGRSDLALDSYRRSFAADPRRAFVADRLLALAPPREKRDAILPALQRAVAADPRLDVYHDRIGVLLAESRHLPEAIASFRRAVDLAPDDPRYAADLAAALAQSGRWPEAAEAYERALLLEPNPATALRLGSVYRRLERPRDALAAFERAQALGDDSPATYLGLALARRGLGQRDLALRAVEDGLARHPSDTALTRLRGEFR